MKALYIMGVLLVILCCIVAAVRLDLRSQFTKCQESVLGQESVAGHCGYPARIMRIKGVWVCSCRSEEETKKGIE
jgi:hypothetical protein